MISIVILTKNEANDLPCCLETIMWCDDIHVFDSLSTDHTCELARTAGAKVWQRAFTNYADQRNAALREVCYKHEWVLLLDADERVPMELASELIQFSASVQPPEIAAARIRRRDYFLGRWLKRAQISPFYIRLVRPARVHYEREINEVLIPDGAVVDLRNPFDHFPFSKGISHWIDKHNRYSSMEARRALDEKAMKFDVVKAIFSRDFNERRYHQKGIYYGLPCRPFLKLFYMLFWRRAILDGYPGVTYSILQMIYEYFIVIKQREATAMRGGMET